MSNTRTGYKIRRKVWESWAIYSQPTDTNAMIRRDNDGKLWEWKTGNRECYWLTPYRRAEEAAR